MRSIGETTTNRFGLIVGAAAGLALTASVRAGRDVGASDTTTDEARAEAMLAIVHDILADADTRASLLDDGLTTGWENGFFIGSADGDFRLSVKGQIQFRWVYSGQDDGPVDDDRAGFESSRTRFGFGGHVFDPSWTFFVLGGWTGNGSSILLDAWIRKQLDDEWSLRAGQFKLPVWQEWTVSETRQQFVERSVLDARYAQSYSQGILLSRAGAVTRQYFAVSDGLRTLQSAWNVGPTVVRGNVPYPQSNEFALTMRCEWKIAGVWKQYDDFASFPGEKPMAVVGGTVHYQKAEYGTADDEIEIIQWTIDSSLAIGGANLYAAVIGTSVESASVDRDELGFLIQGGLFIADDLELIARYAHGDDDGAGVFEDEISVLTVGFNRYFRKHALKWTTDVGYAFDPIDPTWTTAGRGYRPDTPGQEGQIVVRTQMQLLF